MSYEITARGFDAEGTQHFYALKANGKVLHYEGGFMRHVGDIDMSKGNAAVRAEFAQLTGFEPNGGFVGQTQELKKSKVETNEGKTEDKDPVDPTPFDDLANETQAEFEHDGVAYKMSTAGNGKKQYRAAGKMVGQAVFAEAFNAHVTAQPQNPQEGQEGAENTDTDKGAEDAENGQNSPSEQPSEPTTDESL